MLKLYTASVSTSNWFTKIKLINNVLNVLSKNKVKKFIPSLKRLFTDVFLKYERFMELKDIKPIDFLLYKSTNNIYETDEIK